MQSEVVDLPKEFSGQMTVTPLWIERVLERENLDPESLKKLLDVYKEIKADAAKDKYIAAMNAAQAEMSEVVKTSENPHTKSKYAPDEDLLRMAKPVFIKHGFSLSWREGPIPSPNWINLICDVQHNGGHCKEHSGNYPMDGTGAKGGGVMSPVQGVVSSKSYAKRDMLKLIFCITIVGEDKDGNSAGNSASIEQAGEIEEAIRLLGLPPDILQKWLKVAKLQELTRIQYETFMGQYGAEYRKRKAVAK